ncbi:antileukoproteinase-like [Eriocheir sinensis]|uniref:antileukoproteinase-like n=1 Tax=Eriocheir sinensis TaxID=95602 RepID=UPI0021CA3CEF|nr:antileukoproteinase-like [Eriocheir sinensis]
MVSLHVMVVLLAACAAPSLQQFAAPPASCSHWCRTPENQVYCCKEGNEPIPERIVVKPGRCPPVRPVCPPVRNFGGPPAHCSSDSDCSSYDKCCFDRCLSEHVCKPPHNNAFGHGSFGGSQGGFNNFGGSHGGHGNFGGSQFGR